MMHIYCIFCLTAHENNIRKIIERSSDAIVLQASILQRKWVKGTAIDEKHEYLPGYLFIYSGEPIKEVSNIKHIEGVIRFLKYESDDDYEVKGNDRVFAEELYKENGLISYIPVYHEGDRLVIRQGLFQGQNAEIVKVDKRKQRLMLEFKFDSRKRTLWLGYDLVE